MSFQRLSEGLEGKSRGVRSFHSRGPAAEKLLSPSLLCACGTSSFRVSLDLDCSGRRPTSDRRRQSSARYAGAAPTSNWWELFHTSPVLQPCSLHRKTPRWRRRNRCWHANNGTTPQRDWCDRGDTYTWIFAPPLDTCSPWKLPRGHVHPVRGYGLVQKVRVWGYG